MLRNKSRIIIAVAVMLTPLFLQGASVYGWWFSAAGDIEYNNTEKKVADGMKATDAEIHILLGDIGYGEEQCVFNYFKELGVKILAACGNYDDCSDVEKNSGHSNTFGHVHKNVAFQVVNTESSISAQKSSIENNFKKWQTDPNIDTIVVVQHKVTITNPSAHHTENETKGYRDFYVDMKEKYPKFMLLLQAHNHGFQICEPDSPDMSSNRWDWWRDTLSLGRFI